MRAWYRLSRNWLKRRLRDAVRWRAVLVAIAILAAMEVTGYLNVLEQNWRAVTIMLVRCLCPDPVPAPPDDRAVPLAILFSIYREDFSLPRMAPEARWSPDPEVRGPRLARLLGMIAAMPPEYRPAAIGIALPLHEPDPLSDPYTAEAMRALGNVVIGADRRVSRMWQLEPVPPVPELAASAREVALADFPLPVLATHWGTPRLLAHGTLPAHGGKPLRGLSTALALIASGRNSIPLAEHREVPIRYWSLYNRRRGDADDLEAWVANWPHVGADRFLLRAIPWEENEPPATWLARVREKLLEGNREVFDTLADDLGPVLAGRVIIIGEGFPGATVPTPFTARPFRYEKRQRGERPMSPPAIVHATATAGLLADEVPFAPWHRGWWRVPASLAVIASGWLGARLGMRATGRRNVFTAIGVLAVVAADLGLAGWLNVWLPAVRIGLAFITLFIAGVMAARLREAEARAALDATLRQLVPFTAHARLSSPQQTLSASARERRAVTAIAIDMAKFTPWFQALERARATALLSELHGDFFLRMVAVLDQFGAVLTDQTGDGLAACFEEGTPRDQARLAVEAAFRMVAEAERWRTAATARMRAAGLGSVALPGLRVGIAAGETIVGMVGTERQRRPLYFGGAFILAHRVEETLKQVTASRSAVLVVGLERAVWTALGEDRQAEYRVATTRRLAVKPQEDEVEVLEVERAPG